MLSDSNRIKAAVHIKAANRRNIKAANRHPCMHIQLPHTHMQTPTKALGVCSLHIQPRSSQVHRSRNICTAVSVSGLVVSIYSIDEHDTE